MLTIHTVQEAVNIVKEAESIFKSEALSKEEQLSPRSLIIPNGQQMRSLIIVKSLRADIFRYRLQYHLPPSRTEPTECQLCH